MKADKTFACAVRRGLLTTGLCVAGTLGHLLGARGDTTVLDTFTDGSRTNASTVTPAPGDFDIPYFRRNSSSVTFSVPNDAVLGSNALQVSNTAGLQPVIGTFYSNGTNNVSRAAASSVSIAPGNTSNYNTLSFSFDFRLPTTANSATALRFGLYNSNATLITGDNTSAAPSDGDFGYFVSIGNGTTPGVSITKEPIIVGGTILSGSGNTVITDTGSTPVAINDTLAHSARLQLSRQNDTTLSFLLFVDGSQVATATDANAPFFAFDEVAFGNGSVGSTATPFTYVLDNVRVEALASSAVRLISFEALALTDGALLRWRTGLETDNLGFNVFRQVKSAGQWRKPVKLNPRLIAGVALLNDQNADPAGGFVYRWHDAQAAPSALARYGLSQVRYWLQDVDTGGHLTTHPPVKPVPAAGSLSGQQRSPMINELFR